MKYNFSSSSVCGVEHTNFFEGRATEYSRASTKGSWDETFKESFGT